MSLDDCESAYLLLSERIFNPKRHGLNSIGRAKDFLKADGKFDSKALEGAIQDVISEKSKSPHGELLKDSDLRCRV